MLPLILTQRKLQERELEVVKGSFAARCTERKIKIEHLGVVINNGGEGEGISELTDI